MTCCSIISHRDKNTRLNDVFPVVRLKVMHDTVKTRKRLNILIR
jgi:hypothetical protein